MLDGILLHIMAMRGGAIQVIPLASDPMREPGLARDLAERFLVWDAYVHGQRRVDACPLVLPAELHDAAVLAAEQTVALVGSVAMCAHADAAERALYGFDDDALRLATASYVAGDTASLMRVDLLLDEEGQWKACEINADCPGGHNEAFGLPRLARAAGFHGGYDPTHALEELVATLTRVSGGGAVGLLHATGYAEDLQVCALIARALQQAGVDAILSSPTAPRLRGGELCIHGRPVSALYRYFPIEWMGGQRNVEAIACAIEHGRVRTLTSFAHAFTQSKLAFARCWRRADAGDPRLRHLPETYAVGDVSSETLVRARRDWVVKRALGRVGDEVFVGALCEDDEWSRVVHAARARAYGGEPWVAQRFVRQCPVPTPWGSRLVTLGTYVLGGRFVGYFARITAQSHVSHEALCVPVFAARSP